MASVTTGRPINLGQLSNELGGVNLTANTHEGVTVVSTVDSYDQAALEAAVASHVAIDEDANKRTVEDRAQQALTGNAAFLASPAPTAAQVAAQVRALTRQSNALIRLALGKFDATD